MQGREVFVVDAVRTPVGRLGGALAKVRPDDLGAVVIRALLDADPTLDPARIGEVHFGAANQAGEDNRNVARMAVAARRAADVGARLDASTGCAPPGSTRWSAPHARSPSGTPRSWSRAASSR